MGGAVPPLAQYGFMAWCSVKAQGHLYLHLLYWLQSRRGWIKFLFYNFTKPMQFQDICFSYNYLGQFLYFQVLYSIVSMFWIHRMTFVEQCEVSVASACDILAPKILAYTNAHCCPL